MPKPRVMILKAAGINCDQETAFAFQSAGADVQFGHINQVVCGEQKLSGVQILAVSGGFTYGDDIAAGKILANELKYKLADALQDFIRKGNLILGVCNGFQVLVKAGLLPGYDLFQQQATLAANDSGFFEDRWVYLKTLPSACVWTKGLPETIYLPIAHGEGKFIPLGEEVLERLRQQRQIVFQYCDQRGRIGGFPINPNGSIDHIAGICDPTGRIFGLMPHPERHLVSLQHPRWTREGLKKHGDGFAIFLNAVNYFK
ncbi:MAG: phosphoribosylformylglycinamidine synthase I [Candidatus Omnitrophota bacterium]